MCSKLVFLIRRDLYQFSAAYGSLLNHKEDLEKEARFMTVFVVEEVGWGLIANSTEFEEKEKHLSCAGEWIMGCTCMRQTGLIHPHYWAKINNMLVSGNMTPPKMGRKVGKKFYFKKKFCPIFYFMTHLFPTAQLKNRGVEAQGHKKLILIVLFMFYWIK